MREEEQKPIPYFTAEGIGIFITLALRFMSAPSRVLMVKPGAMGRRAHGLVELAGAGLFLPIAAAVMQIEKGMQWVIPVSGFLCLTWVIQKVMSFSSQEVEEYVGTTWFSVWFPKSQSVQVMGEVFFWLLVTAVFGNISPPLAFGMVFSGLASALLLGLIIEREKREIELMVSERKKQSIQAERFRQMSGE
ncbi:hypothetical protein J8F10_24430 [Gemmata sp. G18]|uniref:Uncharacterized protein n=1 Tax=Gemmata palustris TaxID=2822762 RepID=A0ABS5BXH4_9BACT|nr:hypothetical protein [Gemmata palustris]MBP3958409.1 hypothetical protein [Gemmata palustris]